MPDARCPMPDARCPMPDARCPMPDALCRIVPHLSEKGYNPYFTIDVGAGLPRYLPPNDK